MRRNGEPESARKICENLRRQVWNSLTAFGAGRKAKENPLVRGRMERAKLEARGRTDAAGRGNFIAIILFSCHNRNLFSRLPHSDWGCRELVAESGTRSLRANVNSGPEKGRRGGLWLRSQHLSDFQL